MKVFCSHPLHPKCASCQKVPKNAFFKTFFGVFFGVFFGASYEAEFDFKIFLSHFFQIIKQYLVAEMGIHKKIRV